MLQRAFTNLEMCKRPIFACRVMQMLELQLYELPENLVSNADRNVLIDFYFPVLITQAVPKLSISNLVWGSRM